MHQRLLLPISLTALFALVLSGCWPLGRFSIVGVIIVAVITVYAIAILDLANQPLSSTVKAVWVLIILCWPVLGTILYFVIVKNKED